MTIDFTCQKCETSFELDAEDLIDGTEKLVCPNCDAKAPVGASDDFISALVEIRAQVASLAKRFAVNMAIETEDVAAAKSADEDDDEESDEDDLDLDEDEEDDEEGEEDSDEGLDEDR